MTLALYVVGCLLVLVGLAGLLLPALPGAPLIFLGALAVAWADGFARIGVAELLVLGGLAIVISAVDFLASIVGAKRFGSSRWGLAGAFAGLLIGLPFGLAGLVAGPVAGAVLAEVLVDSDLRRAGRVGVGTLIGFVLGTALKYALAIVMVALATVFWTTS